MKLQCTAPSSRFLSFHLLFRPLLLSHVWFVHVRKQMILLLPPPPLYLRRCPLCLLPLWLLVHIRMILVKLIPRLLPIPSPLLLFLLLFLLLPFPLLILMFLPMMIFSFLLLLHGALFSTARHKSAIDPFRRPHKENGEEEKENEEKNVNKNAKEESEKGSCRERRSAKRMSGSHRFANKGLSRLRH